MQTNLLNWAFFIVMVTNVVIMIEGDTSKASLKKQETIASIIKFFAISIILLDIMFVGIIGEKERTDYHSNDQAFKRKYPRLYSYLDIIGFRSNNTKDENDFVRKFTIYVTFFLLSIYLENHFIA